MDLEQMDTYSIQKKDQTIEQEENQEKLDVNNSFNLSSEENIQPASVQSLSTLKTATLEDFLDLNDAFFEIQCYKSDFFKFLSQENTTHIQNLFQYCLTSDSKINQIEQINQIQSEEKLENRKTRIKYVNICKSILDLYGLEMLIPNIIENEGITSLFIEFLQQDYLDGTCSHYFSLILKLLLKDSDQFGKFLNKNILFIKSLINACYSKSINEQVTIFLVTEVENKESKFSKFKIMDIILEKLKNFQKSDHDSEWLENISNLLSYLLDQSNKSDINCSSELAEYFLNPDEDMVNILFAKVIEQEESYNQEYLMRIIQKIFTEFKLFKNLNFTEIYIKNLENLVNILENQNYQQSDNIKNQFEQKITFFGHGKIQILYFFGQVIKRNLPEMVQKLIDTNFLPFILKLLETQKWNNILLNVIDKLLLECILSKNEQLLHAVFEGGKIDIISFIENQYRKKNILTNQVYKNKQIEINNGNIGILTKIILIIDQNEENQESYLIGDYEYIVNQNLQKILKNSSKWQQLKKEKLKIVKEFWHEFSIGQGTPDNFCKLEKQWQSYVKQPSISDNSINLRKNSSSIMTQSQINSEFLKELPQIERDTSFIMTDTENIREIILDRALVGCKNIDGCDNPFCRDNQAFWIRGINTEADAIQLLEDQDLVAKYKPCVKQYLDEVQQLQKRKSQQEQKQQKQQVNKSEQQNIQEQKQQKTDLHKSQEKYESEKQQFQQMFSSSTPNLQQFQNSLK